MTYTSNISRTLGLLNKQIFKPDVVKRGMAGLSKPLNTKPDNKAIVAASRRETSELYASASLPKSKPKISNDGQNFQPGQIPTFVGRCAGLDFTAGIGSGVGVGVITCVTDNKLGLNGSDELFTPNNVGKWSDTEIMQRGADDDPFTN